MATPLTFGIEIEFALATLDEKAPDPHPNDPRPVKWIDRGFLAPRRILGLKTPFKEEVSRHEAIKESIAQTLRTVGLPARSDISPDIYQGDRTASWYVSDDLTINTTAIGHTEYYWWKIELKSPIYYFHVDSLEAVRLALDTLTRSFRIHVNESCGLHVHVGDGAKGLEFWTLRELAAFLWTFEPLLDTIHPEHRFDSRHCRAFRVASILADRVGLPQDERIRILDGLKHIFEVESSHDLVTFTTKYYSRQMAYNFLNLFGPLIDPIKRTIEFRQHASTLDPVQCLIWVVTVVGIMDLAQDGDPFDLFMLLMEQVKTEKDARSGTQYRTVSQLMGALDLKDQERFYWGRD